MTTTTATGEGSVVLTAPSTTTVSRRARGGSVACVIRRVLLLFVVALISTPALSGTTTAMFASAFGVGAIRDNMQRLLDQVQARKAGMASEFDRTRFEAEQQAARLRKDAQRTEYSFPNGVTQDTIVTAHSFARPLLTDSFLNSVRHWDFGLATVVTQDYVRLTPEDGSREGYLWNDVSLRLKSWSANVGFKVHGSGSTGADGFAIWLSTQRYMTGGPLFGMPDTSNAWKGIGIIFDSFDNDGARDNPSVYILTNTDATSYGGGRTFRTSDDLRDHRAQTCVFDFRGTNYGAPLIHVDIDYSDGELLVSLTKNGHSTVCGASVRVDLSNLGPLYFGMTGHTGGLADAHDIHYFIVTTHDKDVMEERTAELTAMAQAMVADGAATATPEGGDATAEPNAAPASPKPAAPPAQPPRDFSHHDEKAEKERWKAQGG